MVGAWQQRLAAAGALSRTGRGGSRARSIWPRGVGAQLCGAPDVFGFVLSPPAGVVIRLCSARTPCSVALCRYPRGIVNLRGQQEGLQSTSGILAVPKVDCEFGVLLLPEGVVNQYSRAVDQTGCFFASQEGCNAWKGRDLSLVCKEGRRHVLEDHWLSWHSRAFS